MNYGLWIMDYGLWIMDYGLEALSYFLPVYQVCCLHGPHPKRQRLF